MTHSPLYSTPMITLPFPFHSCSRSLNFWILPVAVLGRSQNSTALGHLNAARCSLVWAMMSSALVLDRLSFV